MKFLVSLTFLLSLTINVNAQDLEFYTIDEFKKKYPNQVKLMTDFSEIVRSAPKKTTSNKKVKITFIYPGDQISDYWRRSVSSFKKRMNELNIKYELKDFFTKTKEVRKQTKNIIEALQDNPDYLVFTLDAKKHEKLISRILNEGKTKIMLQNITTPKKVWSDKQPFLYVGFDHLEGSKLLADYYIKKTGGKGNYSVLYFTRGYVNEMRGKQFIKYINLNSKLKLNDTYYTLGRFEKAKQATDDIIKNGKTNGFIYACSTDIAIGAIESYKGKKNKPMINGWGGGSRELEEIMAGNMDVTVMRMNDDNGVAMAEAIKLDIEGNTKKVPTIYSGDFQLVEKGISKNKLEKLKDRAFRYSGK